jgi:chemotaxis protein CheC
MRDEKRDRYEQRVTELAIAELDALNEIGNIGSGNAATALSQLLGARVQMSLPRTAVCTLEEACAALSHDGGVGIGVEVEFSGGLAGTMMLTLTEDSALELVSQFAMLSGKGLEDSMVHSALMEVGNIISCSFVTALSDFLSAQGKPSPPMFVHDYFEAFVCNALAHGADGVDEVLVFTTELKVAEKALAGELVFMPSPETYMGILKGLQVTEGVEEDV